MIQNVYMLLIKDQLAYLFEWKKHIFKSDAISHK